VLGSTVIVRAYGRVGSVWTVVSVVGRRVGDFARDLVLPDIDDDDPCAVRHEQAMSCGIDRQLIPTAFTPDRDLLHEPIRPVLRVADKG